MEDKIMKLKIITFSLVILTIIAFSGCENTVSDLQPSVISTKEPYTAFDEPSSVTRLSFPSTVWERPTVYDAPELNYKNVKAIYYKILDYKSKETRAFAYIGYPEDASASNKKPAVVLVHGGGGVAYPQWVEEWVKRGYIAIAMDTEGNIPVNPGVNDVRKRQSFGGPSNPSYSNIKSVIEEQWMYQAVADVYIAHSLLANDEMVDPLKIGIVGISWGGLVTSIAISNADCFAFAVPIYGCGYLSGSHANFGKVYNTAVAKMWDASNWLRTTKTPVLWVDGDADPHFSADAISNSALNTKNSTLSIKPGLLHGHGIGWSITETYAFADSIVKGSSPLIKITKQPTVENSTVEFTAHKDVSVESCKLYYRTSPIKYDSKNNLIDGWEFKILDINENSIAFVIPPDTKAFYVVLNDNRGYTVSTSVIEIG